MSLLAISWAWQQDLPRHLKVVLLALADRAHDDGICWPSVLDIARRCGVRSRTIRYHLNTLRDRGLLNVQARPGRANIFRLHLKSISPPLKPISPPPLQSVSPHPCNPLQPEP